MSPSRRRPAEGPAEWSDATLVPAGLRAALQAAPSPHELADERQAAAVFRRGHSLGLRLCRRGAAAVTAAATTVGLLSVAAYAAPLPHSLKTAAHQALSVVTTPLHTHGNSRPALGTSPVRTTPATPVEPPRPAGPSAWNSRTLAGPRVGERLPEQPLRCAGGTSLGNPPRTAVRRAPAATCVTDHRTVQLHRKTSRPLDSRRVAVPARHRTDRLPGRRPGRTHHEAARPKPRPPASARTRPEPPWLRVLPWLPARSLVRAPDRAPARTAAAAPQRR